jgi:hypothetical protein
MDLQEYIDISTAIVNTGGLGGLLYTTYTYLSKAQIVENFFKKTPNYSYVCPPLRKVVIY